VDLLHQCWHQDPAKRPTFEHIITQLRWAATREFCVESERTPDCEADRNLGPRDVQSFVLECGCSHAVSMFCCVCQASNTYAGRCAPGSQHQRGCFSRGLKVCGVCTQSADRVRGTRAGAGSFFPGGSYRSASSKICKGCSGGHRRLRDRFTGCSACGESVGCCAQKAPVESLFFGNSPNRASGFPKQSRQHLIMVPRHG
jgi:hypothetical protein